MQRHRVLVLFGALLVIGFGFGGVRARAATPTFTIAATNVTMSSRNSSGYGSSLLTLTSVNAYAGSVIVTCAAASPPPPGAKAPYCGGESVTATEYTLTKNGTVTGNIPFSNLPVPTNSSLLHRRIHGEATGLALAGVLLLGFGVRRRAARWLTLALFALGTLTGLAGIGACGGSSEAVTPGTYAYAITATDGETGTSVSTTIYVEVP